MPETTIQPDAESERAALAQPGDTFTDGDRVVHVNATALTAEETRAEIPDDAVVGETVSFPVERYETLSAAAETLVSAHRVDASIEAFVPFEVLLVREPRSEATRTLHAPRGLDTFVLDDDWVLLSDSNVIEHRVAYGIAFDEPRLK